MKAEQDPPVGYAPGGVQTLIEAGSPRLLMLDDALRIERPGADEIPGNRIPQQMSDVLGFGLQLQDDIRVAVGKLRQGIEHPEAVAPHQRIGGLSRPDVVGLVGIEPQSFQPLGETAVEVNLVVVISR